MFIILTDELENALILPTDDLKNAYVSRRPADNGKTIISTYSDDNITWLVRETVEDVYARIREATQLTVKAD